MPRASVDPRLLETARLLEWRTRRILGAVRFEDRTTRRPVTSRLRVRLLGVDFWWNRFGDLILCRAQGLASHVEAFRNLPDLPAVASLSFNGSVEDSTGTYLARSFSLRLPRDPDPSHHDRFDSLFQPERIALFPSPTATSAHPLWSQVRLSLARAVEGGSEPLSGALVRITDTTGSTVLGSGLTDSRGEGVAFIPGVPLARSAQGGDGDEDEPVLVYELSARLQVVWKPLNGALPDPDLLEAEHETLVRSDEPFSLKAGRTERIRKILTIT